MLWSFFLQIFLCSLWYSDKAVRVINLLSGSRELLTLNERIGIL